MIPLFNITRVQAVSLAGGDYEDAQGFFVRASTGGTLVYVPFGNGNAETITKTIVASEYFVDCELVRKIVASGTTATGIYAGKAT